MASAIKACRVCGKDYEACRSANRGAGVFRWQEVACSPECGAVYLERINESRGTVNNSKRVTRKKDSASSAAAETIKKPVFEFVSVEVAGAEENPEDGTSAKND